MNLHPRRRFKCGWRMVLGKDSTQIHEARLVVKCNHTHTLSDIVAFIRASRPGESARNFILQTSHPVVKLERLEQTVKEAGLLNSVIVQRYV